MDANVGEAEQKFLTDAIHRIVITCSACLYFVGVIDESFFCEIPWHK